MSLSIEVYRQKLADLLAADPDLDTERDLRHLSLRIKRAPWAPEIAGEARKIADQALRAANAMVFAEGSRS